MTKSENFMLLYILSQNNLYLEYLKTAKMENSFYSGAECHHHNIVHVIRNITEILDLKHTADEFETYYKKHYIRELFNKADEEDACRFLKEEYLELGGNEEELYE